MNKEKFRSLFVITLRQLIRLVLVSALAAVSLFRRRSQNLQLSDAQQKLLESFYEAHFFGYVPSHTIFKSLEALYFHAHQDMLLAPAAESGFEPFANSAYIFDRRRPEIGVAFSEILLNQNRQAAEQFYRKIIVADIRELPFATATLGSLVSIHAFDHFPQPERALKEISRCLKKDGIFMFSSFGSLREEYMFPFYLGIKLGLGRFAKQRRQAFISQRRQFHEGYSLAYEHNLFSRREWTDLIEAHNMKVIKYIPFVLKRQAAFWSFLMFIYQDWAVKASRSFWMFEPDTWTESLGLRRLIYSRLLYPSIVEEFLASTDSQDEGVNFFCIAQRE